MAEQPFGFKFAESVPHADNDFGHDIQRMMSGKYPGGRQLGYLFQRGEISGGVGRGIVCEQRILVHQVAGEKISPFLFPKAHMPRGVSRGMQHFDLAPANINYIMVAQYPCRSTLKHDIAAYVKALGQLAAVRDHAHDSFGGQRKLPVKPIQIISVGIKIGELSVSAGMIPVDMCGYGGHGLDCKPNYFGVYIAYT